MEMRRHRHVGPASALATLVAAAILALVLARPSGAETTEAVAETPAAAVTAPTPAAEATPVETAPEPAPPPAEAAPVEALPADTPPAEVEPPSTEETVATSVAREPVDTSAVDVTSVPERVSETVEISPVSDGSELVKRVAETPVQEPTAIVEQTTQTVGLDLPTANTILRNAPSELESLTEATTPMSQALKLVTASIEDPSSSSPGPAAPIADERVTALQANPVGSNRTPIEGIQPPRQGAHGETASSQESSPWAIPSGVQATPSDGFTHLEAATGGPNQNSPLDRPTPPLRGPGAGSASGGSNFVPLVALLALLALAVPASFRRRKEVPVFSAPNPFVCALERPG